MESSSKTIQEKQIKIKGMYCKSCGCLIEEELKTLEGVEEVKVNFAKEQAFIRFDSTKINFETMEGKIRRMGYKVSLEDKNNKNPEKIIRIKFGKPNLLTVLIGITLILTLANLYYTANLQKKIVSLAGGSVLKSENSTTEALKEVQPKQPSQPSQPPSKVEVDTDDDPVKGYENAPVTIIEFSEYQCPFGGRFFKESLPQIEENYIKTGKVKHVFRDFPLSFHQYAQKAAEASECADEQGKFWEYHNKLFENQDALDTNNLKQYAKNLDLDTAKFNDCLDSGKMASEVQKDFNDGSQYGVSGTPTFFINGIKLVGAQPYSAFEQLVEQELNK